MMSINYNNNGLPAVLDVQSGPQGGLINANEERVKQRKGKVEKSRVVGIKVKDNKSPL